jgi:hypothetical protein
MKVQLLTEDAQISNTVIKSTCPHKASGAYEVKCSASKRVVIGRPNDLAVCFDDCGLVNLGVFYRVKAAL